MFLSRILIFLMVCDSFRRFGSCAATVASVSIVRDLFPVKDIPNVFSLLMLVVGLSPMLAPKIGGYITADYGWHIVFFILMCLGILILLAAQIRLPNTFKPDASISLKQKPIIANFISIVKEPQFYTYAFTGAVAFSGLFTYVAASPMVVIMTVTTFGFNYINFGKTKNKKTIATSYDQGVAIVH